MTDIAELNQMNFELEREAFEEEMLGQNHKGEWCWLKDIFCQEGWCRDCQIYLDWKKDSVKA